MPLHYYERCTLHDSMCLTNVQVCVELDILKVLFIPAGSLVPQTRWSNTYYHVSVNCVYHKWLMFDHQQRKVFKLA